MAPPRREVSLTSALQDFLRAEFQQRPFYCNGNASIQIVSDHARVPSIIPRQQKGDVNAENAPDPMKVSAAHIPAGKKNPHCSSRCSPNQRTTKATPTEQQCPSSFPDDMIPNYKQSVLEIESRWNQDNSLSSRVSDLVMTKGCVEQGQELMRHSNEVQRLNLLTVLEEVESTVKLVPAAGSSLLATGQIISLDQSMLTCNPTIATQQTTGSASPDDTAGMRWQSPPVRPTRKESIDD